MCVTSGVFVLQLSSYLLSVCFSGSEVWAGDNRGLLHTFSMSSGCLTPVHQFKTHTSLVTGVHYTPGALYTCSSDRSIKVSQSLAKHFCLLMAWIFYAKLSSALVSYLLQVHLPSAPPKTLCTLHHQAGVNGVGGHFLLLLFFSSSFFLKESIVCSVSVSVFTC